VALQVTRALLSALLVVGCYSFITPAARGQADIDLGPIAERHEMIPMRDGNRLSAYLYFPQGSGPWPAVFEQRYADLRGAGTRRAAAKLAEAGYVVALVNFRGTHLSEGTWVGYRALGWGELKDGYDTCEWLAKQSWCTGNVGTFGSSQGGYAQNFLAVTQPPHLKCQYMVDTGLSLFQEGYRIGGTTRPQRFLALASNCRKPDDNRRLLEEWFRHPNYDDYWRDEDCSLHFDKMNVPCFTIGSWFDFMNQGSIASFLGRQHQGGPNSRGKQQLVIGPWLHGGAKSNRIGELVYPENAVWPTADHMVRWFDHYLKDKDNGIERDPAVRYYVMGAVGEANAPGNVWRTAGDWPPPAAESSLYLQAGGGLSSEAPIAENSSTTYVSDPLHPMQIPGTAFPGAKDARAFEQQADVRTFTTAPLSRPIEWTGRVQAELYVSSTARDTDFLVRISDVYPDGRSILIMDYPCRARYREGFDHEALLVPGPPYQLQFDVGRASQIFNVGHRIRVTVASTGAPLYEPNPQTGGPPTIEFPPDAVKATNSIHHSRVFASRIIAPAPFRGEAAAQRTAPRLLHVQSDRTTGSSAAVVVPDVPLTYTAQLLPFDESGKIPAGDDAATQFDRLITYLDATILRRTSTNLDQIAKLNIYLTREELAGVIRRKLADYFPTESRPAVSFVVTPLPDPNALVALDAVAYARTAPQIRSVGIGTPEAEVLYPGNRLYVSGQAQPGSLREATRKTLESLSATIKHCGRADRDIVHLKCFFGPMHSVAEVREEISRYFGTNSAPPTSFVEWRSSSPIEIELVAWGGPPNNDTKEVLEFITPPGMTASPVYSRVARINRGPTIFIGDIITPTTGSVDEQLKSSFDALGKLLNKTGSDFKHLAKATYYVTDDEIGKAHNAIRTKYYDPARPPAASKALVAGVGREGVRYVMDMIAVPVDPKP
jgi:predicted acyl esterase